MSEIITQEDCKLSAWDVVDYLTDDNAIAAYLEAAAEENDPDFMVHAINDVARARNERTCQKNGRYPRGAL